MKCRAVIISLTPDGEEVRIECREEATREGRLCYAHQKYADGLAEPVWTDDTCLDYDAGIRAVVDSKTGAVYARR